MGTGLSGGGSITDVTLFKPYYNGQQALTLGTASAFNTYVNIAGKGYLQQAICNISANSGTLTIRITIDGGTPMLFNTTNGNVAGIIKDSSYSYSSNIITRSPASGLNATNILNPVSYPPSSNVNNVVIINKPIYFKQSLLVEIEVSATAINFAYEVIGGIM